MSRKKDNTQSKEKAIAMSEEKNNVAVKSISYHLSSIVSFFGNRNTNANAEYFNSNIKLFRSLSAYTGSSFPYLFEKY